MHRRSGKMVLVGIAALICGCANVLGTEDLFAVGGAGGDGSTGTKTSTSTGTGTSTGTSTTDASSNASSGTGNPCFDVTVAVAAGLRVESEPDHAMFEGTTTVCLTAGPTKLRARCANGDNVDASWGHPSLCLNEDKDCDFTLDQPQTFTVVLGAGESCSSS